jgi:3-oxoacyl-[acyl-carrier protein] reductase
MTIEWSNVRYDFSGASVLVTGGTGGLGAAVASAFRDAGAEVSVTGTRPDATDYDIDLYGMKYYRLNVESQENVDRVAAAIPRLDVLVNSAGIVFFNIGLDEYDPAIFERAVTMHLTSVHRLATRCMSKLAASTLPGGASVISMASMSSYFGIEAVPAYGVAKTGLLGLTRVLAVHWAPQRIRVNALAVGMAESGMTKEVLKIPEINNGMLARTPLKRHGTPADVAGATLFLCSDAASWITGQTMAVDGGFSIMG